MDDKFIRLWLAFFLGLILSLFFGDVVASIQAHGDELCPECCQTDAASGNIGCGAMWFPYVDGQKLIGAEFYSAQECKAFTDELDQTLPPFTPLECREEEVERQEG
jgi:hypothetical protein